MSDKVGPGPVGSGTGVSAAGASAAFSAVELPRASCAWSRAAPFVVFELFRRLVRALSCSSGPGEVAVVLHLSSGCTKRLLLVLPRTAAGLQLYVVVLFCVTNLSQWRCISMRSTLVLTVSSAICSWCVSHRAGCFSSILAASRHFSALLKHTMVSHGALQ